MSEQDNTNKQNSRLERFLVISKFVLLVFIAISFVLFYSCSYRHFPVSTAQHHFAEHDGENNPNDVIFPKANVLIVMDYYNEFDEDEYSDFRQLNKLINNLPHIDYDLVLIKGSNENSTILNNIDNSLLLRVYHKKEYQYIISFGDRAIMPAKEIQGLFYPSAQMLLYGVSGTKANDVLLPIESVGDNIANTILTAKALDPHTNILIFLCQQNDYCKVIMNIVENQQDSFGDVSCVILNTDEYNVDQATAYINEKGKNSSVFYISFIPDGNDSDISHDDIIAEIQNQISKPIYNLAPVTQKNNIQNSIKYWPLESSDSGTAYIGIRPENITIHGCELVEFAVSNIISQNTKASAKQYADTSSFISQYMENVEINKFPSTVSEQFDFCQTNSMMTSKENLEPGDLIFTSTKANGTQDDIDSISIYVNEEVVIRINSLGVLCFTKPLNEEYTVAYAHPYPYSEDIPPMPNQ